MTGPSIISTVDAIVEKHFETKREFAEKAGVSPQLVQKWRKTKIPAERVLGIEEKTGIPRHELRPDLYPIEKRGRSRASS